VFVASEKQASFIAAFTETFYQRRLEFEQVDLVVLEAVGRCVKSNSVFHVTL
jgi:hypothetical protein